MIIILLNTISQSHCISHWTIQMCATVYAYRAILMMQYLNLILILVSCGCCVRGENNYEENPEVEILKGRIKGIREQDAEGNPFYAYYGIPYAKPPTGDLRFKEPVAALSWKGLFDATNEHTSQCTQNDFLRMGEPILTGDEDCLSINVFTPIIDYSKPKLSVMVCIHGGAFEVGGHAFCGPKFMIREEVVFVSIQYRLNIFGFLSTEDDILPGNLGLKDQNFALQWVQKNIAAFGGDPSMVTIMGLSAGGASVHYHVLSPKSAGLFNRAIMQSGNALMPWAFREDGHRKDAEALGHSVGCPLKGSAKYLLCLQTVEAKKLFNYFLNERAWTFIRPSWKPRVDDDFIPDEPLTLLKSGKFNKVDLVIGITQNEGALFTLQLLELGENWTVYKADSLFYKKNEEGLKATNMIYSEYLGQEKFSKDSVDLIEEMFSDRFFVKPHQMVTSYHMKYAGDNSLFVYKFKEVSQTGIIMSANLASHTPSAFVMEKSRQYVSHGSDLFVIYSFGPPLSSEDDIRMSHLMTKMLSDFAKSGNVTPPGSDFDWEKTTKNNLKQLSITKSPEMEPLDFIKEKGKFFTRLNLLLNRNIISAEEENTSQKDEL